MRSLILATSLTLAFTANAHLSNNVENNVRYVGNIDYVGFCKAVVEDDVALLKAKVAHKVGTIALSRRGVLKKLTAEDGMSCNGESLIEFSEQYHAEQVKAYLTTAI